MTLYKADLHFHPGGFFGPKYSKSRIEPLIELAFKKDIEIVGLTSCLDRRYDLLTEQLINSSMGERGLVLIEEDTKRKITRVQRLNPNPGLVYFLDVQEFKCKDGDLNVICPGKVLEYGLMEKTIEEIATEAKSLGALTSLGHPIKDELARKLIEKKLIDYIDVWDSLDSSKNNRRVKEWYLNLVQENEAGYMPRALAVSDGHRDCDLGKSFTEISLKSGKIEDFFEGLKKGVVIEIDWSENQTRQIGTAGKLSYAACLGWSMIRGKFKPYPIYE